MSRHRNYRDWNPGRLTGYLAARQHQAATGRDTPRNRRAIRDIAAALAARNVLTGDKEAMP